MPTATANSIGRSGPEIRQALAAADRERFEADMREALAGAALTFDLTVVERVLSRWHALATMAANPLTDAEREQVSRARGGDMTGLRARDEHGNWSTLESHAEYNKLSTSGASHWATTASCSTPWFRNT